METLSGPSQIELELTNHQCSVVLALVCAGFKHAGQKCMRSVVNSL